jgi:LmbE family N-acetylglucosaminyl deacetylase
MTRASGIPGDLPDDDVTVDLPVPPSALAIGAHPDDIEFGCGATLAKWAAGGCRISHLVLTDGSKGSWDPDADQARLVEDRADECRAAAAVLDGETGRPEERVLFLGGIDGELGNGVDERRAVCRIIRQLRPAVVLGHDPWRRYRLHPDHRHAGFLTVDALVAARDPHFFPEVALEPHRPVALLLWEPDLPNHVENAGGFERVKIDALLCHRSQHLSTMSIDPALPPGFHSGIDAAGSQVADPFGIGDFADKVHRQLAAHGRVASLDSGEAFHLIRDL